MKPYLDTGVLLKLYMQESFTDQVQAWVAARRQAIEVNDFQLLEARNALHLKLFRKEAPRATIMRAWACVQEHVSQGRLRRCEVDWPAALVGAATLAERYTSVTGCRTLDLLHLAIARQWGCDLLVSLDDRQLAVARLDNLPSLDPRLPLR